MSEPKGLPRDSSLTIVPDLCQINALLLMLILTQIMSFILTLMLSDAQIVNWEMLGQISIFAHCVVLSCAAVICSFRRFLHQRSVAVQISAVIVVVMTISGAFAAFVALKLPVLIHSPPMPFILRCVLISALISLLMLRYFALQAQWRQQKQAELKARLDALQARIRPHFLFNSMNTIASLIASDPEQAENAVLDLASVFRMTLHSQDALIPLKDEIALCRRYLNLESLRLGERLRVEWTLNGLEDSIMIPPLILQPLVENAICHGIQPLADGGTISITSYRQKNLLSILITNPYPQAGSSHEGNRMALNNIRDRLQALYDGDAILKTSCNDQVFTAALRIPVNV
jgi:two-component system sensor histidine kinase AlgZ